MRNKLQKFTDFANSLLPHETQYLLDIQQLEDQQKLGILERVDYNCRHIDQFTPYDETLDKRKYSNLKNWITERLQAVDVDVRFEWMSQVEREITSDAIAPETEKELLRAIRQYRHPEFFFMKFYELVKTYRHFLLIRMRYTDHQLAHDFLETYQDDYAQSKRIYDQLHEATMDIVRQYSESSAESIQWEKWLVRVFYQENLDGYNRYMAFVRLTFICFNYRKFDLLWEKFDFLDQAFREGKFYSKRLLLNYYHLRMLLHAKLRAFDQGIHYGYLAIREKTHDYLFYVNNLSVTLLRAGRGPEALEMMRQAAPEMKITKNFYNKIGFVANYVKCLLSSQLLRNAENYAETFLRAFEKEILQYRWHTFFSAYLATLLALEKYAKIIRVARKYQLLEREKTYQGRADYVPAVLWYTLVAQYKEGQLDKAGIDRIFHDFLAATRQDKERRQQLSELLRELRPVIPEVVNYLPFHANP